MVTATAMKPGQTQAGWCFRLGLIVLVVGWLSPLCIPLITATDLPTRWKTIISGALTVGIPEVFTVAAIAIMGKSGYNLIKERIFSFLDKYGPPDRVSLTRYRIGLVMFVASLFVLGGDFWDKIRALFIHQARVQFAAETSK